jgi:hypothetical protein
MSSLITISNVTSNSATISYDASTKFTSGSTTITLLVTGTGYSKSVPKVIAAGSWYVSVVTFTGLPPNTKYTVKATASIYSGVISNLTATKTFTTLSDLVTAPVGTVSLSLNGTSVSATLAISTLGSNPVPSYRLFYGSTSVSSLTITAIGSTTTSLSGFSPGALATVAAQSSVDSATWTTFAQNSIRVAPTFTMTSSATCTKIAVSVTVSSADTVQYKVIATPSVSTLTAITSDWITSSSSSPAVTTLKNANPGTTYVISCTYTYDAGTTKTAVASTVSIATLKVPTLAVSAASSGMKVSWTSSTAIGADAGISLLVGGVSKGSLVGASGNVFVSGLASNKSYAITVSESS